MPRKKAEEFSEKKFLGCLAHYDDENPEEVTTAIRISLEMARAHKLRFVDACAKVFGGTAPRNGEFWEETQRENLELHEKLDAAEAEIRRLKAEKAPQKNDGLIAFPLIVIAVALVILAIVSEEL